MAAFRAYDDPQHGAPLALCAHDDFIRLLAPSEVTQVAGSVPPSYSFHRHDCCWLALSIAVCDDAALLDQSLDAVFLGAHTLSWAAMHSILHAAVTAGFSVPVPTDFSTAVKAALVWSLPNRHLLRRITAADFESLPALSPALAAAWWLTTSIAAWQVDGCLHPLCQALGFIGRFWDAPSRDLRSRFH